MQFRITPLVAIVILALLTPLVCSVALIAENVSIDLDDIAVDVGDSTASRDIEDFRSERLKANLVIFGILGIIFVGDYISMRPLQHVKINSVATSCNVWEIDD
jgi:hypothetical protein